jgi:hypothetical protein
LETAISSSESTGTAHVLHCNNAGAGLLDVSALAERIRGELVKLGMALKTPVASSVGPGRDRSQSAALEGLHHVYGRAD